MFSSQFQQITSPQPSLIQAYKGVDLTNFSCHKLEKNQLFDQYPKDQLHYVADALQKGLKPHSLWRIKKLQQKKQKKERMHFGRGIRSRRNENSNINKPKPILPKSPESICMKALRTEFLQQFQQKQTACRITRGISNVRSSNIKTQKRNSPKIRTQKIKSPKIIRKKLNQRIRRDQLRRLVNRYKPILERHFGKRMIGYKGYPKVSRQQIKDYLISIGITPDIGQVKFDPQVVKLIALILPKQAELILGKAFGIKAEC